MTTTIQSGIIWLQFPETKIRQEKFRIYFRCPKKIGVRARKWIIKEFG